MIYVKTAWVSTLDRATKQLTESTRSEAVTISWQKGKEDQDWIGFCSCTGGE
jgi:hypothetical protein